MPGSTTLVSRRNSRRYAADAGLLFVAAAFVLPSPGSSSRRWIRRPT